MLKLIDRGPDDSVIEFMARPKLKAPVLTLSLLYGHKCSWCSNVIQALFRTDEPVKLDRYEETRVMSQGYSNSGELLKVIPNSDDASSGYKSDFYVTPKGNAQLIRLKNHLVAWEGCNAREDLWETGERCCKFAGIFVRQESQALVDMAALVAPGSFAKAQEQTIPISFLESYKHPNAWANLEFTVLSAVGRGGPVILFPRDDLSSTYNSNWKFSYMLTEWEEKLKQEAAKAALLEEEVP